MTDDLVEFVRARLEEDAGRAEAARARAEEDGVAGWFRARDVVRATGMEQVDAAMLEVHADPARVLREVCFHRGVLDAYAEADGVGGRASGLGGVVRGLAAVYADHPDYRREWREPV